MRVDGRVGALGDQVQPGMRVEVDGKPLSGRGKRVYLMLNKPVGIVCTADPREKYNVVSYLNYPIRVFPVGRLDRESEGLLLLTSDGEIVNRLLRAEGGHEREYEVEVDHPVTREFVEKMQSGVPILDTVTLPCRVRRTGERSFNIVLVQGLNRQIRRMCDALGYRVDAPAPRAHHAHPPGRPAPRPVAGTDEGRDGRSGKGGNLSQNVLIIPTL